MQRIEELRLGRGQIQACPFPEKQGQDQDQVCNALPEDKESVSFFLIKIFFKTDIFFFSKKKSRIRYI